MAGGDERGGHPGAPVETARRRRPEDKRISGSGVGAVETRLGGSPGAGMAAERSSVATSTPACRGTASEARGSQLAQRLMTEDAWQAHVTREAARAIGQWLEGRGRLHQPIAALTLSELEAMAIAAISRFIVLASERIRERPEHSQRLRDLLLA